MKRDKKKQNVLNLRDPLFNRLFNVCSCFVSGIRFDVFYVLIPTIIGLFVVIKI